MAFRVFYFEDDAEHANFFGKVLRAVWPTVVQKAARISLPAELSLEVTRDATAALDRLHAVATDYDLFVVDLMDEVSPGKFESVGTEMAKVVRDQGSRVPILAISGAADTPEFAEEQSHFENAARLVPLGPNGTGAVAFFAKRSIRMGEVKEDELAGAIVQILEDSRAVEIG